MICPTCNGARKIFQPVMHKGIDTGDDVLVTCPTCKGSGTIPDRPYSDDEPEPGPGKGKDTDIQGY
jgi:DnaJ-class molecular chaperone